MKYLECRIGHAELVIYDPGPVLTSRPVTAQATEKGARTMPMLSDVDKRNALQEALRRTFKQLDPHGQIVNERELPQLVKVYVEHITYRHQGRLWKDGFVVNADGTATLGGVPVPVVETEVERDAAITAAVNGFYQPFRAAGDIAPAIVELRPKDQEKGVVVALFSGEYHELPYLFKGEKCWVGSPRPVERDGVRGFRAPSNKTGGDIQAAAELFQNTMRQQGYDVPLGACQIAASKVLATPAPPKADLGRFLTELFAASERRKG